MNWLTSDLKQKIRTVFEPRYDRKLTNEEVNNIAENLTGALESILKLKWKEKYGKQTIQN